MFNEDKSQIIIANIKAGGVGISLHDTHGKYPRVSIISPSWSAQDILQALGRIHRAKGKTETLQKIIFCKDTIEEKICEKVAEKIGNIAMINDGNMSAYNIEGLIEGSNSSAKELTEEEKREQQLDTLFAKRDRLMNDVKETEEEIKKLIL
jgi:SNF2 family DNA or RNA helicase